MPGSGHSQRGHQGRKEDERRRGQHQVHGPLGQPGPAAMGVFTEAEEGDAASEESEGEAAADADEDTADDQADDQADDKKEGDG